MRKILVQLFALTLSTLTQAQTITLGQISPLSYCVGSTLEVPYQTNGSFAADNRFVVELSAANGSFVGFTNVGSSSALNGSISVSLGAIGLNFHVRVASTDPYLLSDSNGSNIEVVGLPSPQAWVSYNDTLLGELPNIGGDIDVIGLTGNLFKFSDGSSEATGSSWQWKFDSTAIPSTSTDSSPTIEYSTDGYKTASLIVTNSNGCKAGISFQFDIVSCNPVISQGALIVNATSWSGGTSSDDVWVKPGGKYDPGINGYFGNERIFVESGGEVVAGQEGGFGAIYYLKPGSSFRAQSDGYDPVVIENGYSSVIGPSSGSSNYIDTFFCDNLTFDYSQVQPSVVENPPPSNITILQSGDHLFANNEGLPVEIRISNILGAEVLSQSGNGSLDLDLSSLPAGVYFAVVEAGSQRQVQKIVVVH